MAPPAPRSRPSSARAAEPSPPSGAFGRALLAIHLVLSPIVFSKNTVEVFEYNKVAVLLLAAIALSALFLGRFAAHLLTTSPSERSFPIFQIARALVREPVSLGFLLFFLSAILSTIFSISPWTSVFGAHESFAGIFTIAAYTILFFSTRTLCPTSTDARRVLGASVIGAAVASIYAIVQLAQIDPIPWGRVSYFGGFVRPFATMGHPNFLSAFLVIAFPITAYLGLRAAKHRQWVLLGAFGLTGVLSWLAIAFSVSRGAWLALACAYAVVVFGWFRLGERRAAASLGIVIPLALAGLVFVYFFAPGGDALIGSIIDRAKHIAEGATREHIWMSALNVFKDAPIFGCGLDGFQLAFEQKRTVAYWLVEWNGTPTKAHNEALHILATQGVVGAAATLVMTGGLAIAGLRAWRRAHLDEKPLLVAIFAALVGFYVQDVFSFTVAGCGTLFVTLAAILSRFGAPSPSDEAAGTRLQAGRLAALSPPTAGEPLGRYGLALVAADCLAVAAFFHNVTDAGAPVGAIQGLGHTAAGLVILLAFGGLTICLLAIERLEQDAALRDPGAALAAPKKVPWRRPASRGAATAIQAGIWLAAIVLMYWGVVRPAQANWACREGTTYIGYDAKRSLASLEEAVKLDPTKELYWVKLGTAAQVAAKSSKDPAERRSRLVLARKAFRKSIDLVPANSYNWAKLGQVLGEFARERLVSPREAYAAYDEALAHDPNNAHIYADAGNTALALGDVERTKLYAGRGAELYPRFGPTRSQLGYAALVEKRYEESARLFREALDGDWYGDEIGAVITNSNLAVALMRLGQYDDALVAARAVVERAPDFVNARYNLAKALERAGRRDEAIKEYRRILVQGPESENAREALKALGVEPDPAPAPRPKAKPGP
jgi:tetratricopeptide (TPR) repeat protein/O-antigen ligase